MSKKHGEWIDSLSGKNSDLEKRYGVGPVKLSRPGSPTWEEDRENRDNYRKNMQEAARNDYDTRRTLEAAAMSGKKKAQDILDSGFKNIGDIRNAQNFFEKAAKRHGQGGSFSSASDYMGLTQSMVERDREKFSADIDGRIQSEIDKAMKGKKDKDGDGEDTGKTKTGSYNDYLKGTFGDDWQGIAYGPGYSDSKLAADTEKASGGFSDGAKGGAGSEAEAGAQAMLAETVNNVVGDRGVMEKGKYRMGSFALSNLGGKEYNAEGF